MRRETTERLHRPNQGSRPLALVIAGVFVGLIGLPALVLAETELGALSAVGFGSPTALGALAIVPGFLLGALSLVAMLGS